MNFGPHTKAPSYSAHIDLPELHVHRKLTEIAPKFGRFFALPNFRGRAFHTELYSPIHGSK